MCLCFDFESKVHLYGLHHLVQREERSERLPAQASLCVMQMFLVRKQWDPQRKSKKIKNT